MCIVSTRLASQMITNSESSRDTRPHSVRQSLCFLITQHVLNTVTQRAGGLFTVSMGLQLGALRSLILACHLSVTVHGLDTITTERCDLAICAPRSCRQGLRAWGRPQNTVLSTLFHYFAVTVSAER